MSVIASVHGVVPEHQYTESEIGRALLPILGNAPTAGIARRLQDNAKVGSWSLVWPLEDYPALSDFGAKNGIYLQKALELGCEAVAGALDRAGLRPRDVDLIVSTTVTGIGVPSLEARVAARLGLRPDARRLPIFGSGCVGGAADVARMHDYLRGAPDHVAVLLSVELRSLTLQPGDCSLPNLVASALFGDGAAAVAVGQRRATELAVRGPDVLDSRSHLYPDSERTMGWDVGGSGFQVVLSADVPALVGADVRRFLAAHELEVADFAAWVSHPGGPRVIEAITSALELPDDALELTWRSLAEVGNMSSASVLHVLRDTIAKRPPSGRPGPLSPWGPAFARNSSCCAGAEA